MPTVSDIRSGMKAAVRTFWETRTNQAGKQGLNTGVRDTGSRTAVTGGAQMDGFISLVIELLIRNGIPERMLYAKRGVQLPGWFRAEKKWDLIVVDGHKPKAELLACIEFKSHVGPSFGNNFNNRTEEALGSGFDLGAAYREGAFRPSSKPWIGYLMLLEEAPGSQTAVSEREPHFAVFPEFRGASYAARYQILMTKLVRESLYSSVCFLTSNQSKGLKGNYRETDDELTFERFFGSLLGHLTGHLIARGIAMTPTPKKRGKVAAE